MAALLMVLLLDWLALDDITTGNVPSFLGEYAILGVSIFVIPVLYIVWHMW